MTPIAPPLLVVAAVVGWTAGILFFGLWLGERGRRLAAERWVATGSPDQPVAEALPAPKEAEDRLFEAGQAFEKETVERGIEAMLADAKARGVRMTEAEARHDVLTMLGGEDVTR